MMCNVLGRDSWQGRLLALQTILRPGLSITACDLILESLPQFLLTERAVEQVEEREDQAKFIAALIEQFFSHPSCLKGYDALVELMELSFPEGVREQLLYAGLQNAVEKDPMRASTLQVLVERMLDRVCEHTKDSWQLIGVMDALRWVVDKNPDLLPAFSAGIAKRFDVGYRPSNWSWGVAARTGRESYDMRDKNLFRLLSDTIKEWDGTGQRYGDGEVAEAFMSVFHRAKVHKCADIYRYIAAYAPLMAKCDKIESKHASCWG